MDQKTMVKQVFDVQRNTFDNFYKSMITIQDQTEKSVNFFLERSPWMPEESKNMIMEWEKMYKKGRDDFKRAVDDGYNKMESYLATAAQASQQAARATTEGSRKASEKASQ